MSCQSCKLQNDVRQKKIEGRFCENGCIRHGTSARLWKAFKKFNQKDQEKNPLISGRRLSKEESSTPVIPNWASSDDELEQGRDAILSPIFSDLDLQLDISDGTEWDQCPSPNELLNTGFHCPSDRVPSTLRFSGCGSTEEDSVGSLMKQSFSNGDQAGSCSDHSEPGSNVEDNAQEDSGHVDNDAPIPVRSYAAVTFAKPVNSDNTLTKGPSCEGAKVEEKSPMQIPQSADDLQIIIYAQQNTGKNNS